jgi:aminodeoxychorismate lyase
MLVSLNGRLVPEEQAVVSVFDRAFLYGDGLFETLRVLNGKPFRWAQHIHRLRRGAAFLNIPLNFEPDTLRGFAGDLIRQNEMPDALLRITLSRGVGPRGYSARGADRPALVMSLHPASSPGARPAGPEPRWKLITASPRLPAGEALAQFKTCNKLPQILARAEADAAGADEALLLNTDGFAVEGASSNLFWIEDGAMCTPALAGGVLAGVTREVVLELCRSLGIEAREGRATPEELLRRQGVFLSLSSWGVVEALSLDGHPLVQSPLTGRLRAAYVDLLNAETAP